MMIADVIKRESRSVGAHVELICGKHMPGGVVVVTYSVTGPPSSWMKGKRATITRIATYREDGTPLFSAIVSTDWS